MAISGSYKLNQLQPWLSGYVRNVVNALDSIGVSGTVYDVYRSPAEQEARYARGETAARAGLSAHQYGLAFDFVVAQGENSDFQKAMQQFWKWLGFHVLENPIQTTKGPIYDRAHVEHPAWKALAGIR
jgi:hypothetical protein